MINHHAFGVWVRGFYFIIQITSAVSIGAGGAGGSGATVQRLIISFSHPY